MPQRFPATAVDDKPKPTRMGVVPPTFHACRQLGFPAASTAGKFTGAGGDKPTALRPDTAPTRLVGTLCFRLFTPVTFRRGCAPLHRLTRTWERRVYGGRNKWINGLRPTQSPDSLSAAGLPKPSCEDGVANGASSSPGGCQQATQ